MAGYLGRSQFQTLVDITDGSVTTADLADDAVTAAKIGSLPAGSVLQVVQAEYATEITNNTSSLADTGLSASITPSSASNKILVLVTQNGCSKGGSNTGSGARISLLRGATVVLSDAVFAAGFTATTLEQVNTVSFSKLDSPATTSSVTYKTQFRNNADAANVKVQRGGTPSTITLLEIAG